jgi:hypothetical protein
MRNSQALPREIFRLQSKPMGEIIGWTRRLLSVLKPRRRPYPLSAQLTHCRCCGEARPDVDDDGICMRCFIIAI